MTTSLLVTSQLLRKLVSYFPGEMSCAFAYGSGVFEQNTAAEKAKKQPAKSSNNMVDLIFAVDDPADWHRNNLARNSWHYSTLMKYLGPNWVCHVQENFGAGVYYNTLIPIDGHLVKYGVVGTRKLINDLLDWETLYVSGRLHKPVKFLVDPRNDQLSMALKINRQSAVHSSLLLLPELFTEEQLYLTIAGLSYAGDFRMIVGEDKNKIRKIVEPQLDRFRSTYQPLLQSDLMKNIIQWNPRAKNYVQDTSDRVILHHLNLLPKSVQQHLCVAWNVTNRLRDLDDVLQSLSKSFDCQQLVRSAIQKVVWRSSWSQSFKGIITAGPVKSIRYGGKKLVKMFKSMS